MVLNCGYGESKYLDAAVADPNLKPCMPL